MDRCYSPPCIEQRDPGVQLNNLKMSNDSYNSENSQQNEIPLFNTTKEILVTERSMTIRDLMIEEIQRPPLGRPGTITFVRLHAMLKRELKKAIRKPLEKVCEVTKLELNVLMLELIDWILAVKSKGQVHEYWEKRYQADLFIERLAELTAKRCEKSRVAMVSLTKNSIERLRKTLGGKGWFLSANEQISIMSNSSYIKLLMCKYQLYLYHELIARNLIHPRTVALETSAKPIDAKPCHLNCNSQKSSHNCTKYGF